MLKQNKSFFLATPDGQTQWQKHSKKEKMQARGQQLQLPNLPLKERRNNFSSILHVTLQLAMLGSPGHLLGLQSPLSSNDGNSQVPIQQVFLHEDLHAGCLAHLEAKKTLSLIEAQPLSKAVSMGSLRRPSSKQIE
jgi:hypothetical protein